MVVPGFETHDPVVGYLAWPCAAFFAAQVHTALNGSDRSTAIVSKVGLDAQIKCKSSCKPKQPQSFSNISLPLERDYRIRVILRSDWICKIKSDIHESQSVG